MPIQIVKSVVNAKNFREEVVNGQKHLVVPTVMITPGVLNGSRGAGYYPEEENKSSVPKWDGMPLVAPDHPTVNGKHVSARSPEILDAYGIGHIRNTTDDGKLRADSWINEDRALRISPQVVWNVRRGRPVEVSTGLGVTVKEEKGTFGDSNYDWIATNYAPDHLAVLPTKVGACSLKDGCGLAVNSDWDSLDIVDIFNAMSASEVRALLAIKLQEKFPNKPVYIYMDGLYPRRVVFELEDKLMQIKFKRNGDTIVFDGLPQPVVRKVNYVVVNHSGEPDPQEPVHEEDEMNKAELVNAIVNSSCNCWGEEDRETLNGFKETKLQKIHNGIKENEKNQKVVNALGKGIDDDNVKISLNDEGTGVVYAINKKHTEPSQIKMEDLPEELQLLVNFGKESMDKERSEIVNALVNGKTDEQKTSMIEVLNGKSIEDLRFMRDMLPAKEDSKSPSYAGRGFGTVSNSGEDTADEFGAPLTIGIN